MPRLYLAVLASLLVACGARPTRVAVRMPAQTVAGRVEMSFECTRANRVSRCDGAARACPVEVTYVPAPCPARSLTMHGESGVIVDAVVPPDGELSAPVSTSFAPPRRWRVEVDGLPLGTVHRRTYRGTVAALDGLVIAGMAAGLVLFDGEHDEVGVATFLGAAALFALGTPIAHGANGNRRQVGRSLARRLALPALLALVLVAPCEARSQGDAVECHEHQLPLAAVGTAIGAPLVLLWDVVRAEVTTGLPLVTPTVSADRDGATLGLAGRF